jgi:hypothetical protein
MVEDQLHAQKISAKPRAHIDTEVSASHDVDRLGPREVRVVEVHTLPSAA